MIDPSPEFSALILAGGRSSRMGRPKESVVLADGRPMLDHLLDALHPLQMPIHLSTSVEPRADQIATGLRIVRDDSPHEGPLHAIARALAALPSKGILVVCCDQPLLSTRLLRALLPAQEDPRSAFFANPAGESLAPFPGYFPTCALPSIEAAFAAGERSPRRWASPQSCRFEPLDEEECQYIRSFDTMTALLAARLLGVKEQGTPDCRGSCPH